MFRPISVCRFCFRRNGNFVKIENSKEVGKDSLKYKIINTLMITAPFNALSNDCICQTCHDLIIAFYQFKVYCKDSDMIFKRMISNSKIPSRVRELPLEVRQIMRPTQISKAPIAAEKPKEPGNSSGSESLVMSQSREMFNISSVESMSPEKPLEISSVESLNAETSVKRRKLSSEHSLEISSIESLNPNQSADNLEISSIESLNPYTMLTASEMMGMEMCNQGSYQGDSILPDDDGPEPEPEVTKPQPQKRTVKYTVRQFEGSQNTIPLKRPHESMASKSLNKKFLNSTCNVCGRKFVSATNLKLHVCTKGPPKRLVKAPSTGKVEPVLVQKQYKIKCLKCNLVFNNQIAIREHMKVHSNEASAPAVDKEPTKTPLIVRKTVNVWNGTSTKPNLVPSPNQNRTIVIRRKITPTSNGSATSSIVTTTAAKDGSALIRRVIMPKQSTPQKSVETIKIPVISSVYQVKTDNKSKEYVIGDKLVTPKEEKKSGQVVCESYQNPQDQENFEADQTETDEPQFLVE